MKKFILLLLLAPALHAQAQFLNTSPVHTQVCGESMQNLIVVRDGDSVTIKNETMLTNDEVTSLTSGAVDTLKKKEESWRADTAKWYGALLFFRSYSSSSLCFYSIVKGEIRKVDAIRLGNEQLTVNTTGLSAFLSALVLLLALIGPIYRTTQRGEISFFSSVLLFPLLTGVGYFIIMAAGSNLPLLPSLLACLCIALIYVLITFTTWLVAHSRRVR